MSSQFLSDRTLETFGAFCKKFGQPHYTEALQEYICWNQQIIEGMASDLHGPWAQFLKAARNFFQCCQNDLRMASERVIALLEDIDCTALSDLATWN